MPNWYQKVKGNEPAMTRYHGGLSAKIFVPEIEDKDQEREVAYNVLLEGLSQVQTTGESSLDLNIETVEPYGELV